MHSFAPLISIQDSEFATGFFLVCFMMHSTTEFNMFIVRHVPVVDDPLGCQKKYHQGGV